ncbi:hypothetical protein [Bartonella jaculi]|uniref:Uncharacterized protein n=1 Tax=Bartonella jaculi TaxID=686226 RepID=A0ABP9N4A7_9HYPH
MSISSLSHDSGNTCSPSVFFNTAHSAGQVGHSIGSHVDEVEGAILGGGAALALAPETGGLSVVAGALGAATAGGYVGSVIDGAAGYITGGGMGLVYNTYQCINK